MTQWVLVLFFSAFQSASLDAIDFNSYQQCNDAGQMIATRYNQYADYVRFVCVER